jgi:hypothetical protein
MADALTFPIAISPELKIFSTTFSECYPQLISKALE